MLWLDLDCEVRVPLTDAEWYSIPSPLGLAEDPYYPPQWKAKLLPGEVMYNTGVIMCWTGNATIAAWARACFMAQNYFRSDQEVLARIIHQDKVKVEVIPPTWNHLRCSPTPDNDLTRIRHWTGGAGKDMIRNMMKPDVSLNTPSRFTDGIL
jgi:hypothetical protein